MQSQDDQLYAKWDSWIDVLDTEIIHLHTQRHIFHEVQEIIGANVLIQSPGDFNNWMAVWYSSSLGAAMRRQADKNKDSVSYRRLLESIKANPRVISRARHLREYSNPWCMDKGWQGEIRSEETSRMDAQMR